MPQRRKAWIALMTVVGLWCTPTLFAKFLMPYYDPFTQNFLRYASGALFMLPLLVFKLRCSNSQLGAPQFKRLIWPAIPNALHQTGWVFAMQWVYPALTTFLNKSSIIFAAGLAYIFFPEERWVFHSRRFLGGVALALLGTAGLALLRRDIGELRINIAVLLVLSSAAMWALYSVAVKKTAPQIGPTVSFSIVSVYTTAALAVPALLWGNLSECQRAPWRINAIVVVSGILCIGLGHTLYYSALQTLGVSVCATMLLLTPLGTLVLSRLLFGEQMTTGQIVSGIVLLIGGALTMSAREQAVPDAVAKSAESAEV